MTNQEALVDIALDKFCIYLNRWWNEEEMNRNERSPYTRKKFTVWDPENGLYGITTWKVLEEPNEERAFPTGLIKIETSDGDEGGGNQLYVGLQGHFNRDLRISWMVQIFDITPYLIYQEDDGFRSPPNGDFKP